MKHRLTYRINPPPSSCGFHVLDRVSRYRVRRDGRTVANYSCQRCDFTVTLPIPPLGELS